MRIACKLIAILLVCPTIVSNMILIFAQTPPVRILGQNEYANLNWGVKTEVRACLPCLGEEYLQTMPPKNLSIYRFLWLRTFHHPISVRVSISGNEGLLEYKECNGAAGYDPGELDKSRSRVLTEEEVLAIKALINDNAFWALPSEEEKKTICYNGEEVVLPVGLDGAEWLLEGREAERYHIVHRWSPKEGPLFRLCVALLKMAGYNEFSKAFY